MAPPEDGRRQDPTPIDPVPALTPPPLPAPKPRLLLCLAAIWLAGAAILCGAPPNVVLIVSDDQGYHDLGCIGTVPIRTPHLDRLAAEGVRLTSFYVAWPACTPSRAAFLTGRYPQRNGVSDMIRNEAPDFGVAYTPAEYAVTFERVGGMDTREILLPALLKPAGYTSAIYGKWDLGGLKRFLPRARGFDDFYGFVNTGIDYFTHERYGVPSMFRNDRPTQEDRGTYCTDLFLREALRFLGEQSAKPFFLYLPFNAPHGASHLDPRIRSGAQAPEEYRALYPISGPRYVSAPARKSYLPGTPFAGSTETLSKEAKVQEYRGAVTCMDAAIGKVLDFLDQKKLSQNTLIMFFSDNGGSGAADNGPLRGHKGDTWEGGIRVPCIVRWPAQLPAGRLCHEFLTSLEVLPTVVQAAGTALPGNLVLDGYDMLPVLAGRAKSPRREMFWLRQDRIGARVDQWKWVKQPGGQGGLFDLSQDPGERRDLSLEKPEILEMVQARYQAWTAAMEAAEPRGPFRDF